MGWNLLPPLIQVLLKKESKSLPQCLAIFNHLLEVSFSATQIHSITDGLVLSKQKFIIKSKPVLEILIVLLQISFGFPDLQAEGAADWPVGAAGAR